MDCQEIREIIDAYALGGLEPGEAGLVEQHLPGCASCRQELVEAEEAALMLALAAPRHSPGIGLRSRVLAEARKDLAAESAPSLTPAPATSPRWRRWWPALAGGLAAGSLVAVTVLAGVFTFRIDNLESENDALRRDMLTANLVLRQQQQVISLAAQPDVLQTPMVAGELQPDAIGVYYFSLERQLGMISGANLQKLPAGQVYRVWVLTPSAVAKAGDFTAWNGIAQYGFDFATLNLQEQPTAIGVTIEPAADGLVPSSRDYVLYTSLAGRAAN